MISKIKLKHTDPHFSMTMLLDLLPGSDKIVMQLHDDSLKQLYCHTAFNIETAQEIIEALKNKIYSIKEKIQQ